MTFIDIVSDETAEGDVAAMYAGAKETFGYVPNMVKVFSHRPEVMDGWNRLVASIRNNIDARRYELVTIAAAKALKSSYCMLAHGSVLLRDHCNTEQLQAIVTEPDESDLDDVEKAIMRFAGKVVRDATSVTRDDVDGLRRFGLSDSEIFDIAATAAVRCFFSKTLDALGAQPDSSYNCIDRELRDSLVVGRAIEG
jgi:uncharacterized peroxidase-related enzyme